MRARRALAAALSSARIGLAVVACVALCLAVPARAQSQPDDPAFQAFLDSVRAEARREGFTQGGLRAVMRPITPDPEVVALSRIQPEHAKTAGIYIGGLLSGPRIAEGRSRLRELRPLLDRIERRYGVDPAIVLAIWGIETGYGAGMGVRSVTRSLATLAFADRRRAPFWHGELLASLRILENGDIGIDDLVGSWAGAMGHTQFMPSSYLAHAVDFDSDGVRDLLREPADALASTANYLRRFGWTPGLRWGFAVSLPRGFDYALSSPDRSLTASQWRALGVVAREPLPTNGEPLLQLLLPAGARGPAFLTTTNFEALLAYNRASLYALAVGLLADHIASDDLLALPRWPEGDLPLPLAEREEIQRLLAARGLDTGGIDGVLGFKSRDAIRSFQRELSLPEDGHPSFDILSALRATTLRP